jgi:hypothetical protein
MNKITTTGDALSAVTEEQAKQFIDWVWQSRHINCFDPDIVGYPRTIMLRAEDNDGPLLYLPVQPVLMLESLAPKPGISERKEALSLWKLGQLLEDISRKTGIQEQFFLCKDDRVADICKAHGFTELEGYRILRKKIAPVTLEEPTDSAASEPISSEKTQ